jgi:hypothetical protein
VAGPSAPSRRAGAGLTRRGRRQGRACAMDGARRRLRRRSGVLPRPMSGTLS